MTWALTTTQCGYAAMGRHVPRFQGGTDWDISLTELLRLILFYNSGGYYYCPDEGTEDGFCPGPAAP